VEFGTRLRIYQTFKSFGGLGRQKFSNGKATRRELAFTH
jgi:hypothetical protein